MIDFSLNDNAIEFTLNAVIEAGPEGGARLLEDGAFRLLEDDSFRLLET